MKNKTNKMSVPYLIQRGDFYLRNGLQGLDSIIFWDYMGSSEFGNGALGKSISRLRENIVNYGAFLYKRESVNDIDKDDEQMWKKIQNLSEYCVFCKKENKEEVFSYLQKLEKGELRLKEYSEFENPFSETTVWVDIVNDFVFWKQNIAINGYNWTNKLIEILEKDFHSQNLFFKVNQSQFKILNPREFPNGYDLKKIENSETVIIEIVNFKDEKNILLRNSRTSLETKLEMTADEYIANFNKSYQEKYNELQFK